MVTYKFGLERSEVDGVYETEKLCFPEDPWPRSAFSDDADNPLVSYVLAKDGDKVVGYVAIYVIFEAADISNVAVRPEYRRQGIARKLLNVVLSAAKERGVMLVSLEVCENNDAAIRLYESLGFKYVATRKKYYQNTYDALIYQLQF